MEKKIKELEEQRGEKRSASALDNGRPDTHNNGPDKRVKVEDASKGIKSETETDVWTREEVTQKTSFF